MRGTKADVERYISTFQGASPSQKARPDKGFLFAKLYFEAEEYELAKRHVSEYLTIQPKDPNAHKFLGQLFELDGETDKAVGCYKRSLVLNPAQPNLVLKVAELLCGKPDHDSRAEFWVDKAARLLPGNPAVFNLREKLLSAQSGSNQLYKRLHSELKLQPADTHINRKLVQLYNTDGRLEDAVKHCLTVEKAGILRDSLEWYELLVSTLQEYVCQPSVSSNKLVSRKFHKELLLAKCSCVRLTLALKGCEESTAALWSFDCAMQALKNTATNMADELAEVFTEMRAHLYLYAGTLLLKRAQDRGQQWRTVVDLATFCYLISYQAPRPKAKCFNGEQVSHEPLELLACDRQSQAGHMLLNLSPDVEQLLKDVVKAFGNRSSLGPLFYELFGVQTQKQPSFICNDDIHVLSVHPPKPMDLAKWDSGAVLLHAGDLQQLSWLGLQWALMGKSASLQDWLKQLFPLLMLETSKLDTNAPESICLLDLEVFVCGVVFCSQMQLEEKANMPSCSKPHEPRCLPLHIMKQLLSDRQREWWDAVYSLIHKRELPEMTAKVRLVVQLGLSTLRAQEEHGLQPALLIHWAKHLIDAAERVNSFYDQKDYAGRSVHYWKVVLPLLEKVRQKRCIPKPLRPMFMHFRSRDIQPSQVQVYEEDADKSLATLLDIEGNTEEAIANLEKLDSISSNWHLETIYRRLSEQAGNGLEETPGRCTNFLQKFRKFLSKIYEANAEDMEKLPASMEEVMELLNEVNQQLEDVGETEDQVDYPLTSSPCQPTEGHVKFSPPSPFKSVTSPSTRSVFSPKTPPHWVEDQQSMLQMLCQQVEALKNEVHDLRHNSSNAAPSSNRMQQDNYAAEGLQETFPAAQTFHSVPLTDSEVTLEREEQSTANKEQRASSDSNTEAEKSDEFNTELQKLQEAQVKPNPSHDAVAVDTHDGRVEEHQTDTPVADGSLPIDLTTERNNGSDSSTAMDSELTLEREKQLTANEEHRASSDSEAEAEKPDKLQKVKPKPSHNAAAVDTSCSGAKEHQTVTDSSLPIDLTTERSNGSDSSTAMDSELTLEREKQPTANEKHRASSDSEAEAEKPDDFNTELQKVKPKPSHNAAAVDTSYSGAEEHQMVADSSLPIDLTTERSNGSDSSTAMDIDVTLEREKQSTANEEHRASSDSKAEAEDYFNTELQKLQEAQVRPNPSHDAVAVDMRDGGAEERQTDTPVADGSLPINLTTERSNGSDSSTATDLEVTSDKEQRARGLLLPPTFSSNLEAETEKLDDFNSELQKLQEAQVKPKPSHDAAAVDTSDGGAEEHQTDTPVADGSSPNDLSTERSTESDSSTATGLSSGFGSAGGNPFAELAKRSGEFAFGKKDDNHTWPGAGATVFGSGATQNEGEKIHNEAEEEGSDNEVF